MRIGGTGDYGCKCSITAQYLCPIHGDDENLSYDGKRLKADRDAVTRKWDGWVSSKAPCFVCGADIGQPQRALHRRFHTGEQP